MNVLVTGGAGFIGSHIVDALVERNHTVTVIDSLDPAAHDGPPEWMNPNATWRLGPASGEARSADVAEEATWDGALEGIDAVCHQAAKVGLGVDLTDAPAYAINNDLGTTMSKILTENADIKQSLDGLAARTKAAVFQSPSAPKP